MKTKLFSLFLAALLLLSLFTSACSGNKDENDSQASTTEPTTIPAWTEAEALFDIPDKYDVECGYLTVPENRSDPNTDTIEIYFAIFRTGNPSPQPDPIVYLAGGPGENAVESATLIFQQRFAPLMENRDLIIFDQRGTGYSKPSLFCQELTDAYFEYLDREDSSDDIAILEACHDDFVSQGIDLSAYNSAESAADLNDLRLALGYNEWNLIGTSYGTRLALTAMRDHPDGIRSVILASTLPPQADFYEETPDNFNRALDVLYDACAASPISANAYPDLENMLFTVVDELNESPAMLQVTHPLTGEVFDVLLDGYSMLDSVVELLYSTDVLALLPKIIYDAHEGKFGTLSLLLNADLLTQELISIGMYQSVQFNEELTFNDPATVAEAIARYPEMKDYLEPSLDLGGQLYDLYEYWDVEKPDPIENEPVSSDIPTLVLAGQYDPITPPSWGKLAAETLSNSYFFELEGIGHDTMFSGFDCITEMILDFIDDPEAQPDTACVDSLEPVKFIVLDDTMVAFENPVYGYRGVYPAGWEELEPGTYQRTSLAVTGIVHQTVSNAKADDILKLLINSMGLGSMELGQTLKANGYEWEIYQTELEGINLDIAITDDDNACLFVLFTCVQDDYDYYYGNVFVEAVRMMRLIN